MIRVLVADAHTGFREGLKRLLAAAEGIALVGEAQDASDVLDRVRASPADVLVLDATLPGTNVLELIRRVTTQRPAIRVLCLTDDAAAPFCARLLRAGARGCLAKGSTSIALEGAIRTIADGDMLDVEASARAPQDPHDALSDREYQVFQLLASGKSPAEIAAELDLTLKTVGTHKAGVLAKLGMRTTAELMRYAMARRLFGSGG